MDNEQHKSCILLYGRKDESKKESSRRPGCMLAVPEIYKFLLFEEPRIISRSKIIRMSDIENRDLFELMSKKQYKNCVCIGMDHSSTTSMIGEYCQDPIDLLVFDAHIDFDSNEKGMNWSVLSDIKDKVRNCLLIGARDMNNTKNLPASWKIIYDIEKPTIIEEYILKFLNKAKRLYINVDFDVITPTEFPGVSYPECGGITVREMIRYIKICIQQDKNVVFDFVEFNPMVEKATSLNVIKRFINTIIQ